MACIENREEAIGSYVTIFELLLEFFFSCLPLICINDTYVPYKIKHNIYWCILVMEPSSAIEKALKNTVWHAHEAYSLELSPILPHNASIWKSNDNLWD